MSSIIKTIDHSRVLISKHLLQSLNNCNEYLNKKRVLESRGKIKNPEVSDG